MSFHAFAVRSLLFFALAGGAATPALAQHVVTDNEAGKLTLDALTATPAPVFHRVAYRVRSHGSSAVASRSHTVSAVHAAAYRRVGRAAPALHAAAHHGKARRG